MDFVNYIRSSNPLIQVNTYEEFRALTKFVGSLSKITLKDQTNMEAYHCFVWSLHGGVRPVKIENNKMAIGKDAIEGTTASEEVPMVAAVMNTLKWLDTAPDNTILFLRDFHPFLAKECSGAVAIIAKIRDMIRPCNATNKSLVFISPNMQIPTELEKDVTPVDFKLPDKAELLIVLRGVCQSTNAKMPAEKDVDVLLDAALGMTSSEAENAFVLSLPIPSAGRRPSSSRSPRSWKSSRPPSLWIRSVVWRLPRSGPSLRRIASPLKPRPSVSVLPRVFSCLVLQVVVSPCSPRP
jgi:hypothetical protein